MEENSPKVMISYTHDSPEHKTRVLSLANQLRGEGIDCQIDQYDPFPKQGWARWMDRTIDEADFVLVVCTATYLERFEGRENPGKGLGGQWEGFLITQDLYEAAVHNTKFVPVVFSSDDARFIPKPLRASTHFCLDLENAYDDLYRLVTDQPLVEKPALGPHRVLSEATPSHYTLPVPPTVETKAEADKSSSIKAVSLVLIFLDEGKFEFIYSSRIERGTDISLELAPSDARARAFLSSVSGQFNRLQLAIAYGDTVAEGQVVSITTVHANGCEVWKLKFQPSDDNHNYSLYDIMFNGVTADDMADLRARRILLNDKPSFPRGRNRMEEGMIESMIGRAEGLVQKIASPLPELYQTLRDDKVRFLAAARLMCILYLKLTGIVEHVFKLDLTFEDERTLRISFEGQRTARYANMAPHTISFDGLCELGD